MKPTIYYKCDPEKEQRMYKNTMLFYESVQRALQIDKQPGLCCPG